MTPKRTLVKNVEQRVEELLGQLTMKEKVSLLSGQDHWRTAPIERLGISSLVMTDGPHGVRSEPTGGRKAGPTTYFPTGVSMAASWNPELIEQVGAALAEETRAMDCDVLLGPCVNIVRTPLAGRNFESYSEDPYLAGRIGVAWVKGLQRHGVGASLKHYACNNQEIERNRGSSEVDERTLREIYLAQFETIVKEANPWTVMCSYNRINAVYASQHHYLLNEILKGEWGYEGVVVSDWGANHTIFESVQGGLDLEMPGPAKYYGRLLVEAVRNWQIEESAVDEAARRVLRMVVKSGRMDGPATIPAGSVNTPAHQALARELAEEAITLLKNEGDILPLSKRRLKSVAVIGPNAAESWVAGGGSSFVTPPYGVSPLEGLKAKLGSRVEVRYEQGCDNHVEPPVLKSEYLTPAKGKGHGLWGEYFNNTDLSGEPAATRVDGKLEFWRLRPGEKVSAQQFSVRWTGRLTVPGSGRHVLQLISSGTARLYLDGRLLIKTRPQQPSSDWPIGEAEAYVELAPGKKYDLRVEYVKPSDVDFSMIFLRLGYAPKPHDDDRLARAVELAKKSDVAIVFAGMPAGYESEGRDRPNMDLPGPQAQLIEAVAQANPNTIVVLNVGAPVTMDWLDRVPAVLEAYYPGLEGGNAVANVLLGAVNPSGKLTVTFPRRYEDNPTYGNYPGAKQVCYGESIFVGYRYYDYKAIEPLFPFGFGLSYTTFAYSGLRVPKTAAVGKPVKVSVRVKNTGERAGKEVVQVYVSDKASSLPRPPQELKGFAKIALRPGESKSVEFALDERAFAFYDPYQKQWVVEPGEFEILVGSSSRDIRARTTINLV
jgi:beta-glucosidase